MKFDIKHRFSDQILYSGEGETLAAVVQRAVKDGANLTGASLDSIRDDLYDVLVHAPAEVPALLSALRIGKIDGSTYSGECACLVGTIANARGCNVNKLGTLVPNSSRPAERWFLAITPGITPANNAVAKITEGWIEQWLAVHPSEPATVQS